MSAAGKAPRRVPEPADSRSKLFVLTGMSGSGKSQGIRALEDLGYFAVDNLPTPLLPQLAELTLRRGSGIERAAVVVDIREGAFLDHFPALYRKLRRNPALNPVLIFLDADDETLVRRFSETRRPHPLTPASSAIEGIREERTRLDPLRALADEVLDTSDMTVHELRQAFLAMSRGARGHRGPVVTLLSFGFKNGVPIDADLVFDVRFLPNPHFEPALRPKTGRDAAVASYVVDHPAAREFLDRLEPLLRFLLPQYAREGKTYVTVAVGCTGGKHRSVALAEVLARHLADLPGLRFRVRHRDIAIE
jgi:UPF0042 nucleotide-binding protein